MRPDLDSFPPLALALTLGSAVFHAAWNLLLKGAAGPRLVLLWWALLGCALLGLPALFGGAPIPTAIVPILCGSALLQVAYFLALSRAYRIGDFSVVYPVARGLNPMLLTVWALLFLHESPTPRGWLGLGLILLGLALVGGVRRLLRGGAGGQALAAAACVALGSSSCTAVDAAGARMMPPMVYLELELLATVGITAPLLASSHGARLMLEVGREGWRRILLMSGALGLSYALTLQAFSIARIGAVGSVREVSVVLGALIGWKWLGEGFGAERIAGAGLIFCGILTLAR